MRTMVAVLFSIILVVSPAIAGGSDIGLFAGAWTGEWKSGKGDSIIIVVSPAIAGGSDIGLFAGAWTGQWKSDKGDSAPMRAITTVTDDLVMIVMFQVPAPPAPAFSSLSIGKVNESGNLIIDAASSGIEGGGSEMKFWMDGPLTLKGTYRNQYDSGTFTFRRFSRDGA
ncbi:MAG: hypothetical protein HYV51_00955 [Parcubacteria group bacterium]|nr:hypothetical protein [Parcubacteria group bacterium]